MNRNSKKALTPIWASIIFQQQQPKPKQKPKCKQSFAIKHTESNVNICQLYLFYNERSKFSLDDISSIIINCSGGEWEEKKRTIVTSTFLIFQWLSTKFADYRLVLMEFSKTSLIDRTFGKSHLHSSFFFYYSHSFCFSIVILLSL